MLRQSQLAPGDRVPPSEPRSTARNIPHIISRELAELLHRLQTASSCLDWLPEGANISRGMNCTVEGTDHDLSGLDDAGCRPKPWLLMMYGISGRAVAQAPSVIARRHLGWRGLAEGGHKPHF
jgi:hypothetical protein